MIQDIIAVIPGAATNVDGYLSIVITSSRLLELKEALGAKSDHKIYSIESAIAAYCFSKKQTDVSTLVWSFLESLQGLGSGDASIRDRLEKFLPSKFWSASKMVMAPYVVQRTAGAQKLLKYLNKHRELIEAYVGKKISDLPQDMKDSLATIITANVDLQTEEDAESLWNA